jgi:hypothetical protein
VCFIIIFIFFGGGGLGCEQWMVKRAEAHLYLRLRNRGPATQHSRRKKKYSKPGANQILHLFLYLCQLGFFFASVVVFDSCGGEGSERDEGSASMGKQKGRASSSGMAASLVPHAQGAVPTVGFGGYHGAVRVEPAAPSDPDAPIRLTPVCPLSLCLSP